MIKINIAGDFCIENRVSSLLTRNQHILSEEFSKFWNEADFRILNLESPITDSNNKILKSGRHIKAPTSVSNGLENLNVDYFSLANNHIMDYGVQGLMDTTEIIEKSGSKFFGIAVNNNFFDFIILEKDHIKIGIASFSNNEFSIFEDFDNTGALPIDLIYITELIHQLKEQVNHIIIILHTGLSGNALPSPDQRRFCRHLINLGVAAVLCQHSHVIGAYEYFKDGFISYGQGSFAFDLNRTNTTWNEGYIVSFKFGENSMETQITGIKQFDGEEQIRLLNDKEKTIFEEKLNKVNIALSDEKTFFNKWLEFVNKKQPYYLRELFFFNNKVLRRLFPKSNFSFIYNNKGFAKWLNLFRNQEHSEIIQNILKGKANRNI